MLADPHEGRAVILLAGCAIRFAGLATVGYIAMACPTI
jgi:hypothetical protein